MRVTLWHVDLGQDFYFLRLRFLFSARATLPPAPKIAPAAAPPLLRPAAPSRLRARGRARADTARVGQVGMPKPLESTDQPSTHGGSRRHILRATGPSPRRGCRRDKTICGSVSRPPAALGNAGGRRPGSIPHPGTAGETGGGGAWGDEKGCCSGTRDSIQIREVRVSYVVYLRCTWPSQSRISLSSGEPPCSQLRQTTEPASLSRRHLWRGGRRPVMRRRAGLPPGRTERCSQGSPQGSAVWPSTAELQASRPHRGSTPSQTLAAAWLGATRAGRGATTTRLRRRAAAGGTGAAEVARAG